MCVMCVFYQQSDLHMTRGMTYTRYTVSEIIYSLWYRFSTLSCRLVSPSLSVRVMMNGEQQMWCQSVRKDIKSMMETIAPSHSYLSLAGGHLEKHTHDHHCEKRGKTRFGYYIALNYYF